MIQSEILEILVILEILETLVILEILAEILVILEILAEILEILVIFAETLVRQPRILTSVTTISAIPAVATTTENTKGVKDHTGEDNIPPWVWTTTVDGLNIATSEATRMEDSHQHHQRWYGVIEVARMEQLISTSNRRRNPRSYKNLRTSH